MSIMNPKVAQVFAGDTQQLKFIAGALEQLLGAEKTEALISEILPQEVKPSPKFKGQPLVLFNGLDREQLQRLHGFSDADVDEVFKLMNVTEVPTKTDEEVTREAIETAGTASERADIKTKLVVEGESEASVDAAPKADAKTDKPAADKTPNKAPQAKK